MKHGLRAALMVGSLFAVSLARGATIAYWDFETLSGASATNGQSITHVGAATDFDGVINDVAGNGNPLSCYFDAGSTFSSEVAWNTQTGSELSLHRGSANSADGFWVDGDLKEGGTPVGNLPTWTVEASVRFTSLSGWQTFVGKDGYRESVSTNDVASIMYFQKMDSSQHFRVYFLDAGGIQEIAEGTTAAEVDKWYHVAATSDGTVLRLYVNGILEAETYMDSSPDTALLAVDPTKLEGTDGPIYSWSVGRGMYNDGHGDKVVGYIDDVRISDVALGANDLLYVYSSAVTLPPPAPSARKLWVNGTTNKLYWGASDTATDYIVYRATTSGGPYAAVANTSTNTTYLDVGLTPGTTYYYVISARNQIGEGDPSTELSGTAQAFTIFANSDSSWGDNLNNYKEAVFDGDTATFYDSPDATGYVGIDLGAGNSLVPSQVAYCPRESYTDRMVGGIFQGSNDGYTWDDLYTVTVTPSVGWNYAYPDTSTAYRYLQFYTDSAYGNVAEIEFSEYTPPFRDVVVAPNDGAEFPTPTDITLSAQVIEWGASFDFARMFLNGSLVASSETPAANGTNTLSYAAGSLASGSYTGMVIAVSTAPMDTVTNTWTFTVFDPFNGSTMYNINFQNTGAAVSDGTVIVAPSMGDNQWNNIVNPNGGTGLWNGEVPVALTDVSGVHPININWYGPDGRDFGSNTGLSDPLFQGYYGRGTFEDSVMFTGLSPTAVYDIIVYFTWGWNENLTTFYITEGSGAVTNLALMPQQANCQGGGTYSNIVEGVNYVVFSDITATPQGRIDIQAVSADGGFSGFQIIQKGESAPTESPVIQYISVSGDTVTLSWTAQELGTYTIQRKTGLGAGSWDTVLSGLPAGNQITNVSASGSSQEFYQIRGE